ncbi:MAG TPA: LPS assembly protein LptD [Patescibacteria group bacterium]|nr:LPS assembly protein LptD [Patescibacteria group bacterium]
MVSLGMGLGVFAGVALSYGQEAKRPIVVNGDTVEYSTENKEVTATGNVKVIYEGATLTCQKLTVNTQTKDARAEGDVRLEDQRGVVRGEKVVYNFDTKTGLVINADFMSNPYFGKVSKMERLSERQFTTSSGYMSTCNFDVPHYRLTVKKANFFPGSRLDTRDDTLYIGQAPLMCLPRFAQDFQDPLMHVQLMPGSRSGWGPYMLSAWRYTLADNVTGRLYLDYRSKLGLAEGFGTNYKTQDFGKGDIKAYYTDEKPHNLSSDSGVSDFQRYFVRWRHQWEIDPATRLTSEFYKIGDDKRKDYDPNASFLKDYFYREYEQDSQPLTYAIFQHSFANSSFYLLSQKRTNPWFTNQTEKLPEATYSLPGIKIADSPLYFANSTSLGSYNRVDTAASPTTDITSSRFDMQNKFSLPMRLSVFNVTPFVQNRETVYDTDLKDQTLPARSIFYAGADVSTKFYRVFNVKTNALGLDINGLRHIITPTVSYNFNTDPTIHKDELRQIDPVDALERDNSLTMELSNKLQTKRNGSSVDLATLRLDTVYYLNTKPGETHDSGFSDFLIKLELLPYAWMRLDTDADYNRAIAAFTQVNTDLNFNLGQDRHFGIGQRYLRKGGKEVAFGGDWRLTPKWKLGMYERYQFVQTATVSSGLQEQQYKISRDLHCWTMDLAYDVSKANGQTIWMIFKLKAFPSTELGFDQSYHQPKSGPSY